MMHCRFAYSFPKLCFEVGVRNPFVTRSFVDMFDDQIGYGSVLLRVFSTLPLFLLTETIAGLGGLVGEPKFTERFRKTVYSI